MSIEVQAPPLRAAIAEVAGVAGAHAERTDREAAFPAEALATMRRTGLLGLSVPAELGGWDGTVADLVRVTMELGRVDTSVAMVFAMHCQQVAAVARYGGARLRAELLPAVARGDVYLASVTTEPGKGGHLLTSGSKVEADGCMLRIDRDSPIVTGGGHADGFLVTTLAPNAASPAEVDLVYAAREQLTLQVLGGWPALGMRATESVPMRLTGAVPEWQVVGEHGGFRTIATNVFGPFAHAGWAAAWLGAAAGACSRVVKHLRSPAERRKLSPPSELLLVRLASVRARLDAVHSLLQHTVSVIESGRDLSTPPAQLLINALKTQAAEECFAAVNDLVELAGLRHGYLAGSPTCLERTFRDLRAASLNYGNDRLRLANGALALLDGEVCLAGG
jgi:acyl-CoA dehydrogenase